MICREIPWRSPYVAFSPFVGVPDAHLLHSGNRATGKQWSIMAAFPREVLPLKDQGVECWLGDVQSVIDGRMLSNRDPANLMPIQSGLVGFLGYEALSGLEPSLRLPQSPYRFPDAVFGVYDALVIFSGHYRKAWIVGRFEIACHRLQREIGVDELTPLQKP